MNNRRLGRSGLLVSELSLGTMLFGEDSGRSTPEADAIKMVHAYIDTGGNHIDTANGYAAGRSEEIVGKALAGGKREKVTIASKVRFGGDPVELRGGGLGRRHIIAHAETSLKRLKTDYLDLYYFHGWDPGTPVEESLSAMDDLVRQGKVRYIGVSNFKAWQVMKAIGISQRKGTIGFIAAQYQYSLVVRDIEDEFTGLFKSEGLGCMPWGPLGGGFLSGKYVRGKQPSEGRISQSHDGQEESWKRRAHERNWNILSTVEEIANERNASMAQVSLAWLLSRPWVSSVIIGTRTMEQFDDNVRAGNLLLSAEEITRLDAVSVPPERYPYRMMREYGMEDQ